MEIREVSANEYSAQDKHDASIFDSPAFHETIKGRADEQLFLFFVDEKRIFSLIAGIRDRKLLLPYSAPYALLSRIKTRPKVSDVHEAVGALLAWSKNRGLTGIQWTLPATFYAPDMIAKLTNALQVHQFKLEAVELNFHYDLDLFGPDYADALDAKARQKLGASMNEHLRFETVAADSEEFAVIYDIIKTNRDERGFPLRLTADEVRRTVAVVPAFLFLVRTEKNAPAASAICFQSAEKIAQVIYWGNLSEYNSLKPMNFMAWKIFGFFKERGFRFVDTATATENGIPNFGLCDFKQSIGAAADTRSTWVYSF